MPALGVLFYKQALATVGIQQLWSGIVSRHGHSIYVRQNQNLAKKLSIMLKNAGG